MMDELVQDLTFALEESELKVEVEEESSCEELFRKRRIRKRRPALSSVKSRESLCANQMLVSSANETDSYRNSNKNISGSDTENGFVLPAIRKHRRKKIKHMEIDVGKERIIKKSEKRKKSNADFMSSDNHLQQCKAKSEEESGISASDESNDDIDGQDGDDEMTDFYEPGGGPVSGIPDIPWWEEEAPEDVRLRSIINGALPFMTDKAKRDFCKASQTYPLCFHARINRLPGMAARSIRKGRRRYKLRKTSEKSFNPSDFPRQENKNHKRRKTESIDDVVEMTSSAHIPIPESNTGHQMLINMGWKPGEGLGVHGQGIQNPIITTKRNKRSGLGL